jgi:hypothetical protein
MLRRMYEIERRSQRPLFNLEELTTCGNVPSLKTRTRPHTSTTHQKVYQSAMNTIPDRFNRPTRISKKGFIARRCCALVAISGLAGACGAGEGVAGDAATKPTATSATTTISATAPATSAPATTRVSSPATISSSLPNTTTVPPALTIPEPVRGIWRESGQGTSVSVDDCRQESGFEKNFGKVLTIDADHFTYFESGGRLIEVHEHDESRIDATYDTTYADTPTKERLIFDAQNDGTVLIVRDSDRPGPIRYLRCPAVPNQPLNRAPLALDPFTPNTVLDAGLEAIGCWLRPGQPFDLEPIFFLNGDSGLMVIGGQTITLPESTTKQETVIPAVELNLTLSADGYAATFAAVGPERRGSIESNDRDVTLAVATPDGRRTQVHGVLTCGV